MTAERHRCRLIDVALVAVLTAIELADMFASDPGGRHDPLDVCLLVVSTSVLLVRRRRPLGCALAAAAATVVLAARHAPHIGLGPIAATYAVAALGSRRDRAAALPVLLVGVWLVPLLTADADSIPRNVALFGGAWVLGELMRDRRVQSERLLEQTRALHREREATLALAAEAERARLGREVHDVLTHSVSVMVVQAQGAQARPDEPARAQLALERIERTGRAALGELRTLLRDEPAGAAPRAPQPGLDRIAELVTAAREAGVRVDLTLIGPEHDVPASIELSAYRIVQEALTNVLRHSGARTARVAVCCDAQAIEIEVIDDGDPGPVAIAEGRGITGMRERAAAGGGTLAAEGLRGGGFRVVARLPVARP